MAGGQQPGANSRGRGGKFRKFTRGGGKHFSRDLRPLDADGNEINMWSKDARRKDDDSDEEEEDSDESEEDSEEDSDDSDAPKAKGALSREEKKAEKKKKKDAAIAKARGQAVQVGDLPPSDSDEDSDDDGAMPSNPNHSKAARSQTKAPAKKDVEDVTAGVSKMKVAAPANRKERESLEAQLAKERYRKMHEAGKTDEAKADLARLKLIREKREAEAARKQAEKEERDEQEKAKRAEIDAKEAKKREAALGPKAGGKKGKK